MQLITLLSMALLVTESVSRPVTCEEERLVGITEYPVLAAAAQVEGTVLVHCDTNTDGSVKICRAVSGPSLLAEPAAGNAEKWRFRPAAQSTNLIYSYRLVGHGTRKKLKVQFVFRCPTGCTLLQNYPVPITHHASTILHRLSGGLVISTELSSKRPRLFLELGPALVLCFSSLP